MSIWAIVRRKSHSERREVRRNRPEEVKNLARADNELVVFALRESIGKDRNWFVWCILPYSVRILLLLIFFVYLQEVRGLETPKRLQVAVDPIIFIRKPNVML